MKLFCIKSSSQMVQVIRLQYVINSNLYQGMCSKQGPTLRELCLHFRLRTFREGTESNYIQTTVLDKSGHGCGRFNEIKGNRITAHRYM